MSRRRKLWIGLAIGAVVATAIVGALVLLDVPFQTTLHSASCHTPGNVVDIPVGAAVTFGWRVVGGAAINLTVSQLVGVPVYFGTGSSGTGEFSSNGIPYAFNVTSCAPATVRVSGNYLLGGAFL
jgi:hypothetical protein